MHTTMKLLSLVLLAAVTTARPNRRLLQNSNETTTAPTEDPCNVACAEIYAPVCGSDGVTYENECSFGIEQCRRGGASALTIASTGECPPATCNGFLGTQCPEGFECIDVPNDGCDPEAGGADCIGECMEIVVEPPEDQCDMVCSFIYAPVCGSDGYSYTNQCQLDLENCFRQLSNLAALTSTPGPCPLTGTCASANSCGTQASDGTCWCNTVCVLFGDCCEDFAAQCPDEAPYEPEETEAPNPCSQVCSFIYDPVCGSDGVTYGNQCQFDMENCAREGDDTLEALTSTPGVCPLTGSCANSCGEVSSDGSCWCDDECEAIGDCCEDFEAQCLAPPSCLPECGGTLVNCFVDPCQVSMPCEAQASLTCVADFCDGCNARYYDDNCNEVKCTGAATTVPETTIPEITLPDETTMPGASAASDPTDEPCSLFCPLVFNPVCGSDGVTYSNGCFFGVANCNRQQDNLAPLTSTPGACPAGETTVSEQTTTPEQTEESCALVCPFVFDPVCGSDGVTYSNSCMFGNANCLRRNANLAPLTATPGQCPEPECQNFCTKQLDPVCGSDGVTYGNPCMFENAACQFAKDNANAAALTSTPGPCAPAILPPEEACDFVCSAIFQPVCGSDGQTYSNECTFDLENCLQLGILSIVSQGECPTEAPTQPATTQGAECFLPMVTGPCRAAIPRWFFNLATGECEQFTFGGCMGNANNFMTEAECEPRCEINN